MKMKRGVKDFSLELNFFHGMNDYSETNAKTVRENSPISFD